MKKILAALTLATTLIIGFGCSTGVSQSTDTAMAEKVSYDREGFAIRMEDGRLWVFTAESKDLAKFDSHGEPAKHIVRPGGGPGGITIKATDTETLDAYMFARPGFVTRVEDGRLWIFKSNSEELPKYIEHGEPAKHIVRPGAGPKGMTVKATDAETLDAYLAVVK